MLRRKPIPTRLSELAASRLDLIFTWISTIQTTRGFTLRLELEAGSGLASAELSTALSTRLGMSGGARSPKFKETCQLLDSEWKEAVSPLTQG